MPTGGENILSADTVIVAHPRRPLPKELLADNELADWMSIEWFCKSF